MDPDASSPELVDAAAAMLPAVHEAPGLRHWELLGLRRQDLDVDGATLTVEQTVARVLLLDLGTSPHVAQAIARHADIDVTMTIYAHTNLDAMRQPSTRSSGRTCDHR